jgi:redox-regulated HSP33 family molecular chaperone
MSESMTWQEAPSKTQWGDGMMVATVALSKDATLDLYAHKDDLHLVAQALGVACTAESLLGDENAKTVTVAYHGDGAVA